MWRVKWVSLTARVGGRDTVVSSNSRIALLGVDQIGHFKVQGEVGFVVRQVAGISCSSP